MSDITREELEKQAKEAICGCYYYDLCDGIDTIDDKELHDIIDVPLYSHLQDYIGNYDTIGVDEFMDMLNDCYILNHKDNTPSKYTLEHHDKVIDALNKLTIKGA